MDNETKDLVDSLLRRASMALDEGTGTAIGDAIHFEQAAKALQEQAAEIDRLTLNGIHTCSDRCMRPACVARRERDEVRAALAKAVELLRDEKHGLTDEWCARCASFLAQHRDTSHDA